MAVGYTSWKVLKNKPIDKLESNLWYVSGRMENGVERKMIVVKRDDGDLAVFNPIALDEPQMQLLEEWGPVRYLVAPNPFHRQDLFIWKQRYSGAKVVAPRGGVKAVAKASPVDLVCDEWPTDPHLQLTHPAGFGNKEALLIARHEGGGQTVVTCDAILNLTSKETRFPANLLLGPIDTVSTPLALRLLYLKNKAAWAEQLAELAPQTSRLIPGHGAIVQPGGAGLLTVRSRFA